MGTTKDGKQPLYEKKERRLCKKQIRQNMFDICFYQQNRSAADNALIVWEPENGK